MRPRTCRGDRRIDFAIGKHMHPTQFNQHEGVADHDCVVYGFDSSPHQCIKGCPKRSPIEVTDAEDIHHRWNHHWCATQFENFTKNKDVQAAWTMLSDPAERVLCSGSQTWTPCPIHSRTFRQLHPAEPVHLRRLRRLHRRIAEILRHPDNAHLRSIVVVDARGMETLFPVLANLCERTIDQFSDTVVSLILQTEVLIKDTNLSKWKSRIAGSEAEQRRWVKMRAQQWVAQTLQPEIATPASVRKAIHPSHVLEHESAVWRDEWSHNQVDIPCIRDLLHSVVPRPPACQVDLTIHPTELRRSAMSMVGKAPGPDSWQANDLVTLPEEFWQALEDIWNLDEPRAPA